MIEILMTQDNLDKEAKVYVHLAAGHDASKWAERWAKGLLLGLNDPSPYGYARARDMGCSVTFSEAHEENALKRCLRLGFRVLLGFDFIHARNNKEAIYDADVVWTHTESQFLAVALLFCLNRRRPRPKLLGQSVWLVDNWTKLWFPHRYLYRSLLRFVDVLTFLSPLNAAEARRLFPLLHVETVLFGIPSENMKSPSVRETPRIRVLSVGNDVHRDWQTLVTALGNQQGIDLTIVSSTVAASVCRGFDNVKVVRPSTNQQLIELYDDATMMVVPLRPNKHASGITVIEEAVIKGLPVIASDTGGLDAYFDHTEIMYVTAAIPAAILEAVNSLGHDQQRRLKLATAAQSKMGAPDMGCGAYIYRHVELTVELLGVQDARGKVSPSIMTRSHRPDLVD
jgi:glycosyltransferase involved in cell wall biosynthesis